MSSETFIRWTCNRCGYTCETTRRFKLPDGWSWRSRPETRHQIINHYCPECTRLRQPTVSPAAASSPITTPPKTE